MGPTILQKQVEHQGDFTRALKLSQITANRTVFSIIGQSYKTDVGTPNPPGHLRSINPNMINHFASQSQTCQLFFSLCWKEIVKSGAISANTMPADVLVTLGARASAGMNITAKAGTFRLHHQMSWSVDRWWCDMASLNLVNIGSYNFYLLPDNSKSVPEPRLTLE